MSDLSTTRPDDATDPTDATVTTEAAPGVSGARIQLVDVTKRYPGQKAAAVDRISLDIPAGEIVMLVGPSGCGKTTTLKMINRLIEPTSGQILIDGADARQQDADTLRRKIGYVIQGGSLFPHLTVAANIALVPGLLRWDKRRIAERVDELLELVGLDPARYRDRYPRELSGGQQQRVGVARGLAADPPVILMDEPFGAVDPITRQRLQDELLSIQDELHKTIVCVTHDFDEAVKLGDRIVILREGATIAQYDTPDAILAAPADRFVEDFVGAGASLKQLTLTRVSDVDLDQPPTAAAGEDVQPVRERMRAAGHRSVIVLDARRRPLRWDWDRDLDGATTVPDGSTDLITVDRRATLNDALDSMLTSGHGGAIVTGRRDEYLGVVTVQTVMDRIQQVREDAAEVSG